MFRTLLPFLLFPLLGACTPEPTDETSETTDETSETSSETSETTSETTGRGYVLVEIASIDDPEGFGAYTAAASPTLVAHQFTPVAVTPLVDRIEGQSPDAWTVIIQFASLDAAGEWYDDPDYEAARPLRFDATGATYFALAEGLESAIDIDHTTLDSYLLVHVDTVTDSDSFDTYLEAVDASLEQYGAVQLMNTEDPDLLEGDSPYEWTLLAGFPSESAMQQWRDAPETAEANRIRSSASTGVSSVVLPAFDPSMFEE